MRMRNLSSFTVEIFFDLLMVCSFALNVWSAGSSSTSIAADAKTIMLLEGASIFCTALVGVYVRLAVVFMPLILLSTSIWLIIDGVMDLTWPIICFLATITMVFFNGVKAHRGLFGPARLNPSHPLRRYDRMLLLYASTALLALPFGPILKLSVWPYWGALYFSLLAVADGPFQPIVDRMPQRILKRFRRKYSSEIQTKIGICASCIYVQPAIPMRKGYSIRCTLSASDGRFPEYPRTPVLACDGFRLDE